MDNDKQANDQRDGPEDGNPSGLTYMRDEDFQHIGPTYTRDEDFQDIGPAEHKRILRFAWALLHDEEWQPDLGFRMITPAHLADQRTWGEDGLRRLRAYPWALHFRCMKPLYDFVIFRDREAPSAVMIDIFNFLGVGANTSAPSFPTVTLLCSSPTAPDHPPQQASEEKLPPVEEPEALKGAVRVNSPKTNIFQKIFYGTIAWITGKLGPRTQKQEEEEGNGPSSNEKA